MEWQRQMSGTKKTAEELFGIIAWQQVITFHKLSTKPHTWRGTNPLFNHSGQLSGDWNNPNI